MGVDRESLQDQGVEQTSFRNGLATFFLAGNLTYKTLYSALQTAWVAGILYFMVLIIEDGLEYVVLNKEKVEISWKASYVMLKLWVLVSFGLFMRGFTALSRAFNSSLLKITSYVMMGLMIGVVLSDILRIMLVENEGVKAILIISKSVVAGFTSVLFGIVLLRLQDSFGRLSKYAGIIEIVLGSCFIMVILSPIGLVLLVPATVLEIVILYQGSEFIRSESMDDPYKIYKY